VAHLGRAFLERRFPTIVARCRADGLDPAVHPIPVAPAAHYLMGGIRTDLQGATTLPGLFAAGECACTGVHGANRLASNSLLECLVFGRRAGSAALAWNAEGRTLNAERSAPQPPYQTATYAASDWQERLASIMRAHVGPLRDGDGLAQALQKLNELEQEIGSAYPAPPGTPSACSVQRSALLTARLIVAGALMRRESRGAHFRADYPRAEEAWRGHLVQVRGQAARLVERVAEEEGVAV
jgi:L-aspartate oxidase